MRQSDPMERVKVLLLLLSLGINAIASESATDIDGTQVPVHSKFESADLSSNKVSFLERLFFWPTVFLPSFIRRMRLKFFDDDPPAAEITTGRSEGSTTPANRQLPFSFILLTNSQKNDSERNDDSNMLRIKDLFPFPVQEERIVDHVTVETEKTLNIQENQAGSKSRNKKEGPTIRIIRQPPPSFFLIHGYSRKCVLRSRALIPIREGRVVDHVSTGSKMTTTLNIQESQSGSKSGNKIDPIIPFQRAAAGNNTDYVQHFRMKFRLVWNSTPWHLLILNILVLLMGCSAGYGFFLLAVQLLEYFERQKREKKKSHNTQRMNARC